MPEYRVMPDGEIRVMHLYLDDSWWQRGGNRWERDVADVERTIRAATGLQRVTKRHSRHYVAMRVRKQLMPGAVAAVMMTFGQQSASSLLDGA